MLTNKLRLSSFLFLIFLATMMSCEFEPEQTVTIASFSPEEGYEATEVTITGASFSLTAADNIVTFNGEQAEVISSTATELVVVVPSTATTGKISVTAGGSTAISADDFTVLTDPYLTHRVKEIVYDDGEKEEFFYDANNRLSSSKGYAMDENSVYVMQNEVTYTYDGSGKLLQSLNVNPHSNQNVKIEFLYDNGVFVQRKISTAMVQSGVVGAYTLQTSVTYTYQNGLVATSGVKNGSGGDLSQSSYTYSLTPEGNPKVVIHYTPSVGSTYDVTRIFFKNIKDPYPITDPLTDPFLMKSNEMSSNANLTYSITYETEASGRISKVIYSFPNKPSSNMVATYTYEPKQ